MLGWNSVVDDPVAACRAQTPQLRHQLLSGSLSAAGCCQKRLAAPNALVVALLGVSCFSGITFMEFAGLIRAPFAPFQLVSQSLESRLLGFRNESQGTGLLRLGHLLKALQQILPPGLGVPASANQALFRTPMALDEFATGLRRLPPFAKAALRSTNP